MRGLYNIAVDNQELMELAVAESKKFQYYDKIKDSWSEGDIIEYVADYLSDANCYYENGKWLFYNDDEKDQTINTMFGNLFSDMMTDWCRDYENENIFHNR